ncbi:hypothetical protein SY1_09890 [Fretibacterium fastidiosum]|uniref:Uncharacterized protein n=1 Tax=Fretibacterium fastidiosum TaxID=651822 RepID=A0AB94IWS5_9BACT|nr:hypothetical protein SY1_09890 [Fretibacterium fastidiosum]
MGYLSGNNAVLEEPNRGTGYRNNQTFIDMIYPVARQLNLTESFFTHTE